VPVRLPEQPACPAPVRLWWAKLWGAPEPVVVARELAWGLVWELAHLANQPYLKQELVWELVWNKFSAPLLRALVAQ
jgi:hypothetical protein